MKMKWFRREPTKEQMEICASLGLYLRRHNVWGDIKWFVHTQEPPNEIVACAYSPQEAIEQAIVAIHGA